MRIWAFILIFSTFWGAGFCQENDLLTSYLSTTSLANEALAEDRIAVLVEKLEAKKIKSDRQFLRTLFNSTHRQLLKQYDQYSDFEEIFQNGKYDCLTATALYSVLLNKFDYTYSIIETNYHIFMIVKTEEGDVLLESTDPINGFEYIPEKIDDRIKTYKENLVSNTSKDKNYYTFSFNLFHEVNPEQLTGLLFFNQCVKAFNNQEWQKAIQLLKKARLVYDSPRIGELENLLFNVIAQGELENTATASSSQIVKRDE